MSHKPDVHVWFQSPCKRGRRELTPQRCPLTNTHVLLHTHRTQPKPRCLLLLWAWNILRSVRACEPVCLIFSAAPAGLILEQNPLMSSHHHKVLLSAGSAFLPWEVLAVRVHPLITNETSSTWRLEATARLTRAWMRIRQTSPKILWDNKQGHLYLWTTSSARVGCSIWSLYFKISLCWG